MRHGEYSTSFVAIASLSDSVKEQMAALYLCAYDASNEALFFHDLASKDEVLLVHCAGELVGFTTLRTYERDWKGSRIRVVYSGDTIVQPRHWGQQALAFAWIARMGTFKRTDPLTRLYWLLLVKGHRTFRYLPVFGRSFYPHWSIDRSDLKPLADTLAFELCPDEYNPHTGVMEFRQSRGHLKPALAQPCEHELKKPEVRFFLERNPGFRQGQEMVCLLELEEDNLKPLTLRLFRKSADAEHALG